MFALMLTLLGSEVGFVWCVSIPSRWNFRFGCFSRTLLIHTRSYSVRKMAGVSPVGTATGSLMAAADAPVYAEMPTVVAVEVTVGKGEEEEGVMAVEVAASAYRPPETRGLGEILAAIRDADAKLATGTDWRDEYSNFMWNDARWSPPLWAQVLASSKDCPAANSRQGCCLDACGFGKSCAACRATGHYALSLTTDGRTWVCPMTRKLAAGGFDVIDHAAIVEHARKL